ncbi:unnamed protein product [Mytilus coruscus]|uniref:RNase H type-1 domain-containing protein n=1 Tax=Mytilus coruscus TaxID=42192 RepID=A0A6J8CYT5_MYTCO|nr:unnamed protein product [Mytilus coruscus]
MADDDVLSLSNSGCEDNLNSDLESLFCDNTQKVNTRADSHNVKKPKTKGRVFKGSALPTKRKLTLAKGPKQKQTKRSSKSNVEDIDKLKDKLGIDNLNRNIVSLTAAFQTHITGPNPSTLTHSSADTERIKNRSRDNISVTHNKNRPGVEIYERVQVPTPRSELINWGDHDIGIDSIRNYDFNEFDTDYLSDSYNPNMGFITPPVIGANPADAFHRAFNEPTSEVDKGEVFDENPEDTEWNIPQLNTEEKTGPKIGTNLSKAVNASLSIKSSKDCITEITKRHLRPDNCSLMVVPKVNKEIWENIPRQAHSSDVYLQEVRKSMMAGMVPIVNLANQLAIRKEPIDPSIVKNELSDSISLMGNAYYSLSMKRRYDIRRFLNPRYQRVCSHDIPVNENLFGDNIMPRIKVLGDPTKIPIGINTSRSNRRYMSGSLNSRGPAAGSEQQQGNRPTYLRGRPQQRNLERDQIENLKGSNDYDKIITQSEKSKLELNWWLKNVRKLHGKPIKQDNVLFWIETDASLKGWGACYEKQTAGGRWTHLESICHINFLELLSVCYALKAFCSNCSQCHIGIRSDNSTAVSYIQFMGGMTSEKLETLAIEIWTWCLDRDIFLTAQHIPGKSNLQADKLSRNFSDNHEWKLSEPIFSRICSQLFTPNVDLFASRHNAQVDKFVSWIYDPEAMSTDAFTLSWTNFEPYIFPPFSLIGRVLNKISADKVQRAILIVPF